MDDIKVVSNNETLDNEEKMESDLCDTPDVNLDYLVDHKRRLEDFARQQPTPNDDFELKQLEALKAESMNLRSVRAAEIKLPHGQILDMVATHLGIDYKEVMDGVIDSEEHLSLLNSLLSQGGVAALVFCLTFLPPPPIESGRALPQNTAPFRRVIVSDGSNYPLQSGSGVIVFRPNPNNKINANNLLEELMFTPMKLDDEGGLVSSLQNSMVRSCGDSIKVTVRWGDLTKTHSGQQMRKIFLNDLEAFNGFLAATKYDLTQRIELTVPDDVLAKVKLLQPEENVTRTNPVLSQELENIVKQWYRNIEQILEEADHVRKESDELSPRAELDFWRSWLIRFTLICDEVLSERVLLILHNARHSRKPHVLGCKSLIDRVHIKRNEALDNVKYLTELEQLCQDLYTNHPPTLALHLKSVLYSIRMMYASSRYYNTTERITAVLVKVTNQVVINCRDYLTDSHTKTIWHFLKMEILERIKVCLNLYKEYKSIFREMLTSSIENPMEKPMDCSEANVFVRLASFCLRLEKVKDVLENYLELRILHSSRLEGVEKLSNRLEAIFSEIVTKPYDPLEDRKPQFDYDYDIFKQKMDSLKNDLRNFCSNTIEQCPNVMTALKTLSRFEELKISCLCLEAHYFKQLQCFYEEICALRDSYNAWRERVPQMRFMPPMSSRIAWSRHLLHKISDPMDIFKTKGSVLSDPRAQPVIRHYNSLCKVFLQFEALQLAAGNAEIKGLEEILDIPVFTRGYNNVLEVNWNSYVEDVIKEAESLWKLNLNVPDFVIVLYLNEKSLMKNYSLLKSFVLEYNKLRRSTPKIYLPLLRPRFNRLDIAIDPGLVEVTWYSLNTQSFCDSIRAKLKETQDFLNELADMKTNRIDDVLSTVSNTFLVDLTSAEPLSIVELKSKNQESNVNTVNELNTKILNVEAAAKQIINRFVDGFEVPSVQGFKYDWLKQGVRLSDFDLTLSDDQALTDHLAFRRWDKVTADDLPGFQNECLRLYGLFFQKVSDALVAATIRSLKALRARVSEDESSTPLFAVEFHLEIPNVTLHPSLDQIQTTVRDLAGSIVMLLKELAPWGQLERDKGKLQCARGLKSYYKIIAENKEVLRLVQSMQGAVSLLKPDIFICTENYLVFKYLWDPERPQLVEKFVMDDDPDFFAIEEYMHRLVGYRADIDLLPDNHDISCLRISTVDSPTSSMMVRLSISILCILILVTLHQSEAYKSKGKEYKSQRPEKSREYKSAKLQESWDGKCDNKDGQKYVKDSKRTKRADESYEPSCPCAKKANKRYTVEDNEIEDAPSAQAEERRNLGRQSNSEKSSKGKRSKEQESEIVEETSFRRKQNAKNGMKQKKEFKDKRSYDENVRAKDTEGYAEEADNTRKPESKGERKSRLEDPDEGGRLSEEEEEDVIYEDQEEL